MGVVEVLDPVAPTRAGGWKVDASRGGRNGRVSSEWFNRPDDERYLSLEDLWASVKGRSERGRSRVVQTADIHVEAARDNPERLHLMLPKAQEPVAPTHWAFGQLASIVGAPASYLRQLPAPLAGINLKITPLPGSLLGANQQRPSGRQWPRLVEYPRSMDSAPTLTLACPRASVRRRRSISDPAIPPLPSARPPSPTSSCRYSAESAAAASTASTADSVGVTTGSVAQIA
jgi:hypothetical protein